MEKITPIHKSQKVYYGDKKIKFFWTKQKIKNDATADPLKIKNENTNNIINILKNIHNSVICIQTPKLEETKIIQEIIKLSESSHNRVYLILNNAPYDKMKFFKNTLIRFGINNVCSFILIKNNSGTKGLFFTGSFTEADLSNPNHILIPNLTEEQFETFFRFFSYNFWNKTTHEVIDGIQYQVESSPVEIIPNYGDSCDIKNTINEIQKANLKIIYIPIINENIKDRPTINVKNTKHSNIWISDLQNNTTSLLQELAENKNNIYGKYKEGIYPHSIFVNELQSICWLIPNVLENTPENFCSIKLEREQVNIILNKIKSIKNKFQYFLNREEKIKRLVEKTIYSIENASNPIIIRKEISRSLPDIYVNELTSREAFENQHPNFPEIEYAEKVLFEWKIIPPYLPSGTKKAKLYQKWNNYIQNLREVIEIINKNINYIENNISGILAFGKKYKINNWKNKLNEIRKKLNTLPHTEQTNRNKFITELNNLYKTVTNEKNSLLKEAIKEKIKQIEKELQKTKDEAKKENLKLLLNKKITELNNIENSEEDEEPTGSDLDILIENINKKSKTSSTKNKKIDIEIPPELLPLPPEKSGTLYEDNQKNYYLAIEFWNELPNAYNYVNKNKNKYKIEIRVKN